LNVGVIDKFTRRVPCYTGRTEAKAVLIETVKNCSSRAVWCPWSAARTAGDQHAANADPGASWLAVDAATVEAPSERAGYGRDYEPAG
jgi:hypothetical protein